MTMTNNAFSLDDFLSGAAVSAAAVQQGKPLSAVLPAAVQTLADQLVKGSGNALLLGDAVDQCEPHYRGLVLHALTGALRSLADSAHDIADQIEAAEAFTDLPDAVTVLANPDRTRARVSVRLQGECGDATFSGTTGISFTRREGPDRAALIGNAPAAVRKSKDDDK